MQIAYVLAQDDIIKFFQYVASHSPAFRRQLYISIVLTPLVVWALIFYLGSFNLLQSILFPVAFTFVFITFIFFSRQYRIMSAGKTYAANLVKNGQMGERRITVMPEAVYEKTPLNETKQLWQGIYKIIQTDTHIFIMLNESQGYIIPKHAFANEGHAQTFYQEAVKYHADAIAGSSTPAASHE